MSRAVQVAVDLDALTHLIAHTSTTARRPIVVGVSG